MVHGPKAFAYACKQLRSSTSLEITPQDSDLAQAILARASPAKSAEVIETVCTVAMRWNNITLWSRALKSCDAERSIETLGGEQHVYQALTQWSFRKVRPTSVVPFDVGSYDMLNRHNILVWSKLSSETRRTLLCCISWRTSKVGRQ